MNPKDLLVIMLFHSGGRLSGKTLIQKQAYFLDKYLGLGLSFVPHYYGPYSPELDAAFGQCRALDFVKQTFEEYGKNEEGFEVRRFDFELTADGQEVADLLRRSNPELFSAIGSVLEGIRASGGTDHGRLANAAKTDFVVSQQDVSRKSDQVSEAAGTYGWALTEMAAAAGLDMLKLLDTIPLDKIKTLTISYRH